MRAIQEIRNIEIDADHDDIPPGCYATRDLPLAAFLRCRGMTLRGIQRQGAKSIIIFDGLVECQELARNWANEDRVEVSAPEYSRELGKLKTLAIRGYF